MTADTVICKETIEDSSPRTCKLERGTVVDAYERSCGTSGMLKYRTEHGWLSYFRNGAAESVIEVIDLTRAKPEGKERVNTEELANVAPRRAAFWVLFQFQTGVSHLLADLNRRCLVTPGLVGNSGSSSGVSLSKQMKFTFPLIYHSVVGMCPHVLDFPQVEAQEPSMTAKYKEYGSVSFATPSIEAFGSRETYLTVHAIEHLLRCCFDENSGLNRSKRHGGALLVVHALYSKERSLENLLVATVLVFLRSIEKVSTGPNTQDDGSNGSQECRRFALSRLTSIIKFWRALLVVLQQLGAPGSSGNSREKAKMNAFLQTYVNDEHAFDAVVAHREMVLMLASTCLGWWTSAARART